MAGTRVESERGSPAAARGSGGVCVVGSLNMDLIVRASSLPRPGQTLLGGDFQTLPGGKGANQAVAAARAGARVCMIGAVGDDGYGVQLVDAVARHGVEISGIRRRSGMATGVAVIIVAAGEGGENMIVVAGGANLSLTARDVQESRGLIEAADVLLMQLESPVDALTEAARMARRSGGMVVLNAAPARRIPGALLEGVDVLVVNRSEAAALGGLSEGLEPNDLLEGVSALGPRSVVLTLGSAGAIARIGRTALHVPPFPVRSVDSVAAGDAFAGTLAACVACLPAALRSTESSLGASLTRASAAGALATTRQGAIPSLPTLAEILELVASRPECAAREI